MNYWVQTVGGPLLYGFAILGVAVSSFLWRTNRHWIPALVTVVYALALPIVPFLYTDILHASLFALGGVALAAFAHFVLMYGYRTIQRERAAKVPAPEVPKGFDIHEAIDGYFRQLPPAAKETFRGIATELLREGRQDAEALFLYYKMFIDKLPFELLGPGDPKTDFKVVEASPDKVLAKALWSISWDASGEYGRGLRDAVIDINEHKVHDWMGWKKIRDGDAEATLKQLENSPYYPLVSALRPTAVMPFETRFEHTWILGPQGSGKTQLMQHLINEDIKDGRSSLLVIDSQGDLIKQVGSLASVGFSNSLILVEPSSIAINPFDMKGDAAVDLLTYVFGALGDGAELTPKQSTLYRYCIRLLQEIPEATLKTFVEILQPGGIAAYYPYVPKLSEPAILFFKNQFDDQKQFAQTKQEVAWRLMLLLENPTFERMFCAPRTKLNLFEELGKDQQTIVLVDTSKETLGADRSALFGRFFIALLLHVSQQRAGTKRENRRPVFCYIDEAHEYLTDNKATEILDQARKMRIGLILANQRSAQISNPNTLDALMTTSIKFVHTDNDSDTHMVSRPMKTTPEFIAGLPKQVFAYFARNCTKEALGIEVPFLVMEKEPHLTDDEYARMRTRMRVKYGPDAVEPKQPKEEPPQSPPRDTSAKEW